MAKPAIPPQPPKSFQPVSRLYPPFEADAVPPVAPELAVSPPAESLQRLPQAEIVPQTANRATSQATNIPLQPPVQSPHPQPLLPSPQELARREFEQVRIRDVRLLLEAVFEREETTVRLVLDRLYEIGSLNLINNRIPNRLVNHLAHWLAGRSRPVARIWAMRWFKRNAARLTSDWLYSQVKFEPRQILEAAVNPEAAEPEVVDQTASLIEVETYRRQVSQLNSRVRMLTILLVSVTFTLGGGLAWAVWQQSAWRTRTQPISASQPVRSAAERP